MSAAARAKEQRRRNPPPLAQNQTASQVTRELAAIKCGQTNANTTQWSQVRVVPAAQMGRYNVVQTVDNEKTRRAAVPDNNNQQIAQNRRGRLRQQVSPHAQMYSWLRTNNFDLKRPGGPNLLEFLGRASFAAPLVNAPENGMTAQQKRALPISATKFRRLFEKYIGRQNGAVEFVEWLEKRAGRTANGVASVLPQPSNRAFQNMLCSFAQVIKVTKTLYVQVFVMAGKIRELKALAKCTPQSTATQDFRKRLQGVWGVFHRTCVPAQVFIAAWMEFYGYRLHSALFGPLFFSNLWKWYVDNALAEITQRRNIRQQVQQTTAATITSKIVLDSASLHAYLLKELKAAVPAGKRAVVIDAWDPAKNRPVMPGPPPEFASVGALTEGWDLYLQNLPAPTRQWLGTAVYQGKNYKYRQFTMVNGNVKPREWTSKSPLCFAGQEFRALFQSHQGDCA